MALPLLELPEQAPAEDIDEEILEIFIEEVDEVLEEMKNSYEVWRESPSETEALQTLRRAFHTLKGSGRLVGATVIGELGWAFENMLNKVMDGTMQRNPLVLQLLNQVTEVIPPMIKQFQAGESQPPHATHVLISQADHLTKTKGTELGEFEGGDATQAEAHIEPEDVILDSAEEEIKDTELLAEEEEAVAESLAHSFLEETDKQNEEAIREIFQAEAKGHLSSLKNFLVDCKRTQPCLANDELVRILHTLNGSSRSMEFPDIAVLASKMEIFSRAALTRKIIIKKEIISLFVESGKALEQALKNDGHVKDTAKQNKLLSMWDKLLAALPKDEKTTDAEDNKEAIIHSPQNVSPNCGRSACCRRK